MEERIKNSFNNEFRNNFLRHSERNHIKRHSEWLNKKIEERRNLEDLSTVTNVSSDISMIVDSQNPLMSLSIIEDCVLFFFHNNFTNKFTTKTYLKKFRKELGKQIFDISMLESILFHNKNVVMILSDFIFDFRNSEIQLETLWILNNLCYICKKFNFNNYFIDINLILVRFMNLETNFSNNGIKNLIFEKLFSLISNIMLFDNTAYKIYLKNNILFKLITNLNSTVRSLRQICLLLMNNIISILYSDNQADCYYVSILENELLFNKEIIYYLKFLVNRTDPSKNADESYELLWLLLEFSNKNYEMFNLILYKDEKQLIENTNKLINLSYFERLHQPAIRLLTNLISSSSSNSWFLAQIIVQDKNFIYFISNIFNSNSEYLYLVNDIILLVKSLTYFYPQYFKNSLILNKLLELIKSNNFELKIDTFSQINLITILYYIFSSDNFYDFSINITDSLTIFKLIVNLSHRTEVLLLPTKLIILELLFIVKKFQIGMNNKLDDIYNLLVTSNMY